MPLSLPSRLKNPVFMRELLIKMSGWGVSGLFNAENICKAHCAHWHASMAWVFKYACAHTYRSVWVWVLVCMSVRCRFSCVWSVFISVYVGTSVCMWACLHASADLSRPCMNVHACMQCTGEANITGQKGLTPYPAKCPGFLEAWLDRRSYLPATATIWKND